MTRIRPIGRVTTAATLALALALATTVVVAAHAELLETTPEDGATVEGPPTEIVAVFSEGLEEDGSGLVLRDEAGTEIASGGVDPDDAVRLVIADIPDLAPGDYEVRWTAASGDDHLERDTWAFTVAAVPTPTPTVAPTATATAAPTEGPSDAPSAAPTDAPSVAPTEAPTEPPDDGDPAASTGDVLLPIIVGLAIVALVGGLLLSRRRGA